MPDRDKLQEFVAWCAKHITGDEKGEAQIVLDHLFQSFGLMGGPKVAQAISSKSSNPLLNLPVAS